MERTELHQKGQSELKPDFGALPAFARSQDLYRIALKTLVGQEALESENSLSPVQNQAKFTAMVYGDAA